MYAQKNERNADAEIIIGTYAWHWEEKFWFFVFCSYPTDDIFFVWIDIYKDDYERDETEMNLSFFVHIAEK